MTGLFTLLAVAALLIGGCHTTNKLLVSNVRQSDDWTAMHAEMGNLLAYVSYCNERHQLSGISTNHLTELVSHYAHNQGLSTEIIEEHKAKILARINNQRFDDCLSEETLSGISTAQTILENYKSNLEELTRLSVGKNKSPRIKRNRAVRCFNQGGFTECSG